MAQSFEEFIQYIEIALSSEPESIEDLKSITVPLYTAPDLFQYILQIYESDDQRILKFIPLLPNIFDNFISYYHKPSEVTIFEGAKVFLLTHDDSFFKQLSESNPEYLEYLTEMLIHNYNVDKWFCERIWSTLFYILRPPEILNRIFERMKGLFEFCADDFQDNKELRKAFLLFSCVSSQRTHREIFQVLGFEEFAAGLFINYFTTQNIENESLAQLTGFFIEQMVMIFQYSFDFFLSEENCLIHFFDFIDYLSQYSDENPLENKEVTNLFHKIIKHVHGFIYWILNPDNDRFKESRQQFISSYFVIIFKKAIEAAPIIINSFPYDACSLISRIILRIIGSIIQIMNKDELIECSEVLLQLTYLYADLPQDIQDQYIINPAVFYYSSYCLNILTEYEPRSFSYFTLFYLFDVDPVSTIQFLLNSEPSPGLMFLIGNISAKIIQIEKHGKPEDKERYLSVLSGEILNDFSLKIGELLSLCEFEPDSLVLKANSLLFLDEAQIGELFEISFNILQETSNSNSENFTAEAQFLFTIASKIVSSLITFFQTQEIYNMLQNHIFLMLQNIDLCLTYDAINSINYFFLKNKDIFYENAGMLFDVYLSFILKLTCNFSEDINDLSDSNESKIANSAIKFIKEIFKIENVQINEQSFIDFLNFFFNGKEKNLTNYMSDLMMYAAFFGPPGYIDYFTTYYNYSKNISIINFADFFARPFIVFIHYKTENFLSWEPRDDFIEFTIAKFQEFIESEITKKDPSFEDSYYLGLLVSMFILTPDLLPVEIVNHLFEYSIEKVQFDDYVLKYNCFNIITSIIHVLNIAIPEDIMALLLDFIAEGYVYRKPEQIRYLTAILETKELYSNIINERIVLVNRMIESGEFDSKEEEVSDFFHNDNLGINDDNPYGFSNNEDNDQGNDD